MGALSSRVIAFIFLGLLTLVGCGSTDEERCSNGLVDLDFVDVRVRFEGFDEHVGQVFKMRVMDSELDEEISRKMLDPIAAADFVLEADAICGSHARVDFFADMNGNRRYDPPPVDHAWSINIGDPERDITITFQHDSNYTDVDFPD